MSIRLALVALIPILVACSTPTPQATPTPRTGVAAYITPSATGDAELDAALDGWKIMLARSWGSPAGSRLALARQYWDAHPALARSSKALADLRIIEEQARR